MNEKQSSYDSTSIISLKDLEPVRVRPSLFLGDTTDGSALHRCFFEVFDNSVDEFLAGHATKIDITLGKDNVLTVEDNGRGIPVDIKKEEGISALQVVMCTLNAGGKFDNKSYEISSGLHGIGVSAVNAVSKWLKVEVRRDDKVWFQEYERGIPKAKVKAIGQCTRKTGTKVTFCPDGEIFKENNIFDSKKILNRIREVAYLNIGLEICFKDEINDTEEIFKDKEGLASFIKHLRGEKAPINDIITISHKDKDKNITVDLALQWVNSQSINGINCFTNTVKNTDGGTHLQGFRTGLNRAINKINDEKKWVRGIKDGIKVDDSITGLIAIISVKMQGASFSSQTKDKLVNSEVKGFVDFVVYEGIYQFFSEHNRTGKAVVSRIALSAKAREAARKAKEKVFSSEEFSSIGTLPGKLADCSEKDPEKRCLIITEGESASGTLKQARSRENTAILPLRGKPLNIEKAKLEKIVVNEEIKNIFTSLGIIINKGEVDCSNARYHTIVLAADADPDGNSIRCLLLTLFFRFMKPIIENGWLYIAQPPLYVVNYKKGKIYIKDEKTFEDFKKKHQNESFSSQYLKGLGEMQVDDLYTNILDPKNRIWKKVTIKDAEEADRIVSLLMGPLVPPRAQWIEEHAGFAQYIDV